MHESNPQLPGCVFGVLSGLLNECIHRTVEPLEKEPLKYIEIEADKVPQVMSMIHIACERDRYTARYSKTMQN